MSLLKLKSIFSPSGLKKFQNLQESIHDDEKQHHHNHSFLDPPPNSIIPNSVSKMETDKISAINSLRKVGTTEILPKQKPEPTPSPIPWWMGDTSNYNIDGTPTFETTSLTDIYLNFTPTTTDTQNPNTERSSVGGGFNLNFNNLFKAATGNPQDLTDIFSLGNTKVMMSSEFGDASMYYIDGVFGDVLAVDASINKFGKMGDKFNKIADKVGLPGIKIPNIDLFGQVTDVLGLDGDLTYQNQVYELFNSDAPDDSKATTLSSNGSFYGVPEFNNPYRGIAFQTLGNKNKAGVKTDLSYQGQVVNRSANLSIGNPIAGWRSGDIKFKDIQLPKFDVDLPGLSGLDLNLPKIDFPPLPKIDLPNFDLDFPDLNLPKFSLPKLNLPNVNFPNINLPNLPNLGIGGLLQSVNIHIKNLFDDINLPNFDLPNGFGFPIKFPKIDLPNIKFPNVDFSKVGGALKSAGEFLSGVADNVGDALGNAADALGSAVAPVKDYLSQIKVSPFKVNGQVDWGDFGFDIQAGNLNPIDSVRLPALKLQNPFNVNKTDFGGVGKLVGNQPRSSKLLSTVSRKINAPGISNEQTYTENAQIGTPYAQIGKTKYEDNAAAFYPNLLNQSTGDPHTKAAMIKNLKHLNSGYAVNGAAGVNKIESDSYGMPFYFYDLRDNTYITFRAYIEALTEQLSPSWNPINYVGRSEPVYIYERTERSIDFTLKLHAGNGSELDLIYSKMRRLTSLCYPEYKPDLKMSHNNISSFGANNSYLGAKTRMKPPLTRLRIGELYGRETSVTESELMPSKNDVLGFVKSLSYSVPDTTTWEYRKGQRVPKHIVATISYQVIHDRPPELNTQFYGYSGTNNV